MSWRVESGVLDEEDSAGLLWGSFENDFRDIFLKELSFNRHFGNVMP